MGPAPYPAIEAALITLFGFMVGSFLNVCIYRLPRNLSPARPRSGCPTCGHVLSWYENIPVLSYLVLKGRCRSCETRISVMYPIVETITGVVFLAGYLWYDGWQSGPSLLLVQRLLFACAMIVLFAVDLEHQILPDKITLPGIVVGLIFSAFLPPGLKSALIGILVGGGGLWALALGYELVRKVEALGFGDVKMLAMIGAFLGWKLVLLTWALASVTGGLFGAVLIIGKRGRMDTAVPFGTFLAVAALASAVAGDAFLDWYLGLV